MNPQLLEKLQNSLDERERSFEEVAKRWQSKNDKLESRVEELMKFSNEMAMKVANLEIGGGGSGRVSHADQKDLMPYIRGFVGITQRRDDITDRDCPLDLIRDYTEAFPQWIRRGEAVSAGVRAAMQVGSDPSGGFLVPPETVREIHTRLEEESDVRAVASVGTMSSDSREIPIDTRGLVSGGWVGETQERVVTDSPELGMQQIFQREQYAYPEITQKLLDTADYPVEPWLKRKIGKKFVMDENAGFVAGLGIIDPQGFLTYPTSTADDTTRPWGTLQYIPSGSASGFPFQSGSTAHDADSLIDLSLSLKAPYLRNAKWAMRRSTAGVIRKLKDKEGRWLWVDSLTEGGRPLLLGHEVLLWEDMPAIGANSLSIAFGDWSHYEINDHKLGIRILRDPFTRKGFVRFYAYKRCSGNIVSEGFDAIKLMKFSVS